MSKTTTIKIERKAGNVRFGSRHWAAQQTGWQWEHAQSGDGQGHVYITCDAGDGKRLTVAVVDDDWHKDVERTDLAEHFPRRQSLAYGGAPIGISLMYDLVMYVAQHCGTESEDEQTLTISAG
jgi:hypothetical protein